MTGTRAEIQYLSVMIYAQDLLYFLSTICSSMLMRFYIYVNIIVLSSSPHTAFGFKSRPIYTLPSMHSQLLWLPIVHPRRKSLLELLNRHLCTIPMLHATVNSLRRDEHIAHNVNDAI